MTAADWIANARSLTQSSSIPLGVPVNTHMDMLLRDTRRDLRSALDALEKVLELHKPVPAPTSQHYYCEPYDCDQAGDGELRAECDGCAEWWPCRTAAAITEALGVQP